MTLFGVGGGNQNDPYQNYGPLLNRVGAAMMCLSAAGVVLRFVSRRVGGQAIKIDDYLIVGGLLFSWGVSITQFFGVKYGLGRHITLESSPAEIRSFLIALYVNQIIYILAVALIKFSILTFIRRAFNVASTKLPAYVIGTVIMSWFIALELVGIFSCHPIHGFWDKTIPATCVDTSKFFFGVGIPNIITDVMLIIYPIPFVWRLQMPTSQKIALSGVFTLGGFIIIISCLHLVTVKATENTIDVTWVLVPIGLWNAIECNIGVVLACLSSMRPLLRVMMRQKPKSTAATGSSGSGSTLKDRHQWSNIKRTDHLEVSSFSRLQDDDSRDGAVDTEWKTTGGSHIQPSVYDIELGQISKIQTTIEVDRQV